MTRNRDLANLLDSNGQIDNADIADNTIASSKLSYNASPFRNIIINGDMSIAQRGTSTASVSGSGYFACDRWKTILSSLGTFTISQDTDVPTSQGFAKSFKYDCTTANASPTAGAFNAILHIIEGQNLQYLKKGTANAESLTLSFWVKSNKTGTYTCQFRDYDNTRSISQTYTINSADTWEKKTITISGDTTGAFDNDNQGSLQMWFWLGAGTDWTSGTLNTFWNAEVTANRVSSSQVNLADSTSNYINITGVQLEAGTTASDPEFLPYDVNLNRCLRYCQILVQGDVSQVCNASAFTTTEAYGVTNFITEMRTAPTLSIVTGTDYYRYRSGGGNYTSTTMSRGTTQTDTRKTRIQINISGATAGSAGWIATNNSNAFALFEAEL